MSEREKFMAECDPERQGLINEMVRIINDIDQYFCDINFWNTDTRVRLYPDAAPIVADRDGELARVREGLRRSLQHEAALGFTPTVTYPPVTPSKYIALTDTSELRCDLRANLEGRNN